MLLWRIIIQSKEWRTNTSMFYFSVAATPGPPPQEQATPGKQYNSDAREPAQAQKQKTPAYGRSRKTQQIKPTKGDACTTRQLPRDIPSNPAQPPRLTTAGLYSGK